MVSSEVKTFEIAADQRIVVDSKRSSMKSGSGISKVLDKESSSKYGPECSKSSEWQTKEHPRNMGTGPKYRRRFQDQNDKEYQEVQVKLRGISSDIFEISEMEKRKEDSKNFIQPAGEPVGELAKLPSHRGALNLNDLLKPPDLFKLPPQPKLMLPDTPLTPASLSQSRSDSPSDKKEQDQVVKEDTRVSRLISRTAGKWGKIRIDYDNKRGRFLYVYLLIIDMSSQCLFFLFVLTYTLMNLILSLIFLGVEHPIFDSNDDSTVSTLEKLFFFSVQTMDTIGYGALAPQGRFINYMVVVTSILANCYWAMWVGILFLRFACPSHLKFTIRFSDVACINTTEWAYGGTNEDSDKKYVKGLKSLSLRLADQRPNAVVLSGNISLLYLHRQKVAGGEEDEYEFLTHELDFELNRQRGRNRCVNMSTPSLSIPWKIVHVIDKISPLYRKTVQDIKAERGEIIALINAVDENTSESYQARWSYCGEEILEDQRFVQCMVYRRQGEKDCLCCDLGLLSVTTPCL